MKLFKYQVRWSPYSTAVRAKNKKDAAKEIRRQYPHAKGDFFILF